jgi:hypothetical protein
MIAAQPLRIPRSFRALLADRQPLDEHTLLAHIGDSRLQNSDV